MQNMGLPEQWDIFHGGTEIPSRLWGLECQLFRCGVGGCLRPETDRWVICKSVWKCYVRCSPIVNWTSGIWMNIMRCLTGNFCSVLRYFCSGNCHCENYQVCYHDICNNYIPLSAVKWGRNIDWNSQLSWGLGQWQLIFNFQNLGRAKNAWIPQVSFVSASAEIQEKKAWHR